MMFVLSSYWFFYDFQGDFREENFNTAMNVLKESGDAAKMDKPGRKGGAKGETN